MCVMTPWHAGCLEGEQLSKQGSARRRGVLDTMGDLLAGSLLKHQVPACCSLLVGWCSARARASYLAAVCVQAGALSQQQGGWAAIEECLHRTVDHGRVLLLLENAEDACSCRQSAQVRCKVAFGPGSCAVMPGSCYPWLGLKRCNRYPRPPISRQTQGCMCGCAGAKFGPSKALWLPKGPSAHQFPGAAGLQGCGPCPAHLFGHRSGNGAAARQMQCDSLGQHRSHSIDPDVWPQRSVPLHCGILHRFRPLHHAGEQGQCLVMLQALML